MYKKALDSFQLLLLFAYAETTKDIDYFNYAQFAFETDILKSKRA